MKLGELFKRVIALAASITGVALAMLSGPVGAITLEDYIDPNSAYEDAYVSGRLNVRNAANNEFVAGNDAERRYQTGYDLALNADYRRVFSSLPLVWSWTGKISGTVERPDSYPVGGSGNSTDSMLATIGGSYDRYLQRYPAMFWYGRGEMTVKSEADDPQAIAQLGIGVGRVINATPLAKALRVIDEFQEYGLLTAYPGDLVMMELAQIINREEEYSSRFGPDDYRQPWYEALEAVLLGAGMLNDSRLGAVGVIKLDDVLEDENVATREHGWRAAGGLSLTIQDFDGNRGDPGLSVSFRYAKPYGYKGQLIENIELLAPLGGGGDTSLRNTLSYSHEVSDLVDWLNEWRIDIEDPDDGGREVAHELRSTFLYEISNSLSFDLSLRLAESDEDQVDGVRSTLTTGVSYRLR